MSTVNAYIATIRVLKTEYSTHCKLVNLTFTKKIWDQGEHYLTSLILLPPQYYLLWIFFLKKISISAHLASNALAASAPGLTYPGGTSPEEHRAEENGSDPDPAGSHLGVDMVMALDTGGDN